MSVIEELDYALQMLQMLSKTEFETELSFTEQNDKLIISAIALVEGEWNNVVYPRTELEKASQKLIGVPLLIEHGRNPEWKRKAVGKVVNAKYDDILKSIVAEIEVTDNEIKKQIKENQWKAVSVALTVDYSLVNGKIYGKINEFLEISLTNRPACSNCFIINKSNGDFMSENEKIENENKEIKEVVVAMEKQEEKEQKETKVENEEPKEDEPKEEEAKKEEYPKPEEPEEPEEDKEKDKEKMSVEETLSKIMSKLDEIMNVINEIKNSKEKYPYPEPEKQKEEEAKVEEPEKEKEEQMEQEEPEKEQVVENEETKENKTSGNKEDTLDKLLSEMSAGELIARILKQSE